MSTNESIRPVGTREATHIQNYYLRTPREVLFSSQPCVLCDVDTIVPKAYQGRSFESSNLGCLKVGR